MEWHSYDAKRDGVWVAFRDRNNLIDDKLTNYWFLNDDPADGASVSYGATCAPDGGCDEGCKTTL